VHVMESDAYHRADHQANHFVKKTIARDIDADTRSVPPHANRLNCAGRVSFFFAAVRCEGGKLVATDKFLSGSFQKIDIQRGGNVPRASELKRRQDWCSPNSVAINLSGRGKARVKFL